MNVRIAMAVLLVLVGIVYCFVRQNSGVIERDKTSVTEWGESLRRVTTTTRLGWPLTTGRVVVDEWISGFCAKSRSHTIDERPFLAIANGAIGLLSAIGAGFVAWWWATSRSQWYQVRLRELLGMVTIAVVALAAERAGMVDWLEVPLWLGLASAAVLMPWHFVSQHLSRYSKRITYFGPARADAG